MKLFEEYTWSRYGGYECSTAGDARFSAFTAMLPDGRSIEQHYQCDIKGYDPGGRNWKLGKGKPPLDPSTPLWQSYLSLWQQWAKLNPSLIEELRTLTSDTKLLSDRYATSSINQAHALSIILSNR